MSVIFEADTSAADYFTALGEAPPWTCFRCGAPVTTPAVHWMGCVSESNPSWSGHLFLHPACAEDLGGHFLKDSREAELGGGMAPYWRTRVASALRNRLRSEEGAAE